MAQCTAPVYGHRSSAAAANCPACGGRSRYRSSYTYDGSSYGGRRGSTSASSYGPSSSSSSTSRRTRTGRSVSYSASEWRSVEPYAEKAAEQARAHPDRRDLFLCHAWDDRQGSAADLHRQLKANGATVWFSEEDIPLGSLMTREIDKGLRNSRIGIVLVTPALLKSIENEGIAEKELAVLLNSRRVVPVTHGVTFDELYDVSPMLASHAGLNTSDSSLDDVAAKIAAAAAALPAE
ncbi:toll/interleukin-1 receptor domain-containing protein [Nocardioides sp.]|uniref:toll/interleukin-1 receptor domain-containing protein n=1 Tax=Nocardioides sp. TaxID=35761 RepID=UPI003219956A